MLASFRSRLVLSNLLITLLGLGIVVLVFTQLLTQLGIDLKRRELSSQTKNISAEVHAIYTKQGSVSELEDQVYSVSRLFQERIVVARPNGVILFDSSKPRPSQIPTPFFRGALQGKTLASLVCRNLVCISEPIRGTHGHVNGGEVLIVTQAADLRPNASTLLRIFVIAIGSALAAWIIVGLYSTFSIFRPLQRIIHATEKMALGDYSVRVGTGGQGEIRTLAASFDGMAGKVQQSNQSMRDFLGNVSHDLRTPLTLIAGYSQALLDGTAGPDDVESSAAVIREEADRMQRLVDDLLQLTRLESGLFQLELHPTGVVTFVQGVLDRMSLSRGPHVGPDVTNAVRQGLPPIEIDSDRLERALSNLIENAVAYTPPTGTVSVDARVLGPRWVEISVADTGPGIPSEDSSRIFERFYRVDKGRERTRGHSGLGLAIVREIVEAHGGTVAMRSQPGSGSTFSFTVPIARRGASQEADMAGEKPVGELGAVS